MSTAKRVCTNSEYRKYWVAAHKGIISCGIGDEAGQNIIVAWKDLEPLPVSWLSFSTWDNVATFRNINVDSYPESADASDQQDDFDYEQFIPGYLKVMEEEAQRNKARAERFNTEFHPPKVDLLPLAPEVKQKVKSVYHGETDGGFITGFNIMSAEEQAKIKARAERFMTTEGESGSKEKEDGDDGDDDDEFNTREKRERRAERFGLPIFEDVNKALTLYHSLMPLTVPRRDIDLIVGKNENGEPLYDSDIRLDALHVYGNLFSVFTKDILSLFKEYGPSHVEWLNDCTVNVVFEDHYSCARALAGLGEEIVVPSLPQGFLPKSMQEDEGEQANNEANASSSTADATTAATNSSSASGDMEATSAVLSALNIFTESEKEDVVDSVEVLGEIKSKGWKVASLAVADRYVLIRPAAHSDIKSEMSTGYRTIKTRRVRYSGNRRNNNSGNDRRRHARRRERDEYDDDQIMQEGEGGEGMAEMNEDDNETQTKRARTDKFNGEFNDGDEVVDE